MTVSLGSIPVPLALEVSALTTELRASINILSTDKIWVFFCYILAGVPKYTKEA